MRFEHACALARSYIAATATACVASWLLTACAKSPNGQSNVVTEPAEAHRAQPADRFEWGREALQRNPQIELLATDRSTGVFTVRIKESGEVHAVRSEELAAVPMTALGASAETAGRAAASDSASGALRQPSGDSSHPTEPSQTSASSFELADKPARDAPSYTIDRSDGQIRVSGPGISIVSAQPGRASAERATSPRSDSPIICEGRRMLHLDNRTLRVDGDAVIARGGCELHITNSRIAASGTGVVIEDAIVHIANSTIEGAAASFAAGSQAKVFARSSTFHGLPRRAEGALVQDQGGNEWR